MQIFLFFISILIIFFIVFNLLRKLHWDAIHNNLISLVEVIGGQIIRKGFFARPVYHGNYKDTELTINFSTERSKKKRANYIDISLAKKIKNTITITSLNWLKDRGESLDEFSPLEQTQDNKYGIRKDAELVFTNKDKNAEFKCLIKELDPFIFIFIGKNGTLFERECENIAICTKHPLLKNSIDSLFSLIQMLE